MFRDVAWKARVASLSDADLARFREAIAEAAQPYVDEVSACGWWQRPFVRQAENVMARA